MKEEKITLVIRSEIDGTPIRYNMRVSKEIADNYAQIRETRPELSEVEAISLANKN